MSEQDRTPEQRTFSPKAFSPKEVFTMLGTGHDTVLSLEESASCRR
jgi:hypothetical protein